MPCNCDFMTPNPIEIKMSKVACLLDELDGKPINKNHWEGMHPRVYNQTYDRYAAGYDDLAMVAELVEKIKEADVTKYSLEMQMWWRDYQEAEKARIGEKNANEAREMAKARALSKLTEEEKAALGF